MPFVPSENIIIARPTAAAMLAALSARPAAALLITPFVHLYTAGPAPVTPDSLPADFTEATFVGYAATALALPLLGPINIGPNTIGDHNPADFLGGAVVPPGETILGYWIDEAAVAGTVLYMAETFVSPVPIAFPGDFISLDLVFAVLMLLDVTG